MSVKINKAQKLPSFATFMQLTLQKELPSYIIRTKGYHKIKTIFICQSLDDHLLQFYKSVNVLDYASVVWHYHNVLSFAQYITICKCTCILYKKH